MKEFWKWLVNFFSSYFLEKIMSFITSNLFSSKFTKLSVSVDICFKIFLGEHLFFKVFKVFVQKVLKKWPDFPWKVHRKRKWFQVFKVFWQTFWTIWPFGPIFQKNRKRKWIFSKTFEFTRCLSKKFWKMGRFSLESPQETEVASIF